jgi:8-oxo-dGTP pyrophosphatase MutT (NUDIX family)
VKEHISSPENFRTALSTRLLQPLPGAEAQDAMSSRVRLPLQTYLDKHPDFRTSAVLMLLYPIDRVIHTMIIRRPSYEGIHSGQLALPGGKKDEEDPSVLHTALRETLEEVGVVVPEQNVIGQLTSLYIPPSNFLVHPFIAWLDERPPFKPDPREVDVILEVQLSMFVDPQIKARKRIHIGENTFVDAPSYVLGENNLWGATAMIFAEMEAILNGK